ncbi:hypothetical protein TorRG33x02_184030 [Trema orientale]|uniref:Uncharacterized protein n=1 Tax=Trema orientale TaxID=63057 RepID=A0A2P5EJS9_TREOI|nr:hypothetical protein TorRG33x02_184030 [Trema orientale]
MKNYKGSKTTAHRQSIAGSQGSILAGLCTKSMGLCLDLYYPQLSSLAEALLSLHVTFYS